MTDDDLAWRNLVADWHLRQRSPLPCPCDDDTEDGDFCVPSTEWADQEYAARQDPTLAGPSDPWNHDIWVAAWGRNAPMIALDTYRLPRPPEELTWLATRILVGGRQAIELSLLRLGGERLTTLGRARADAEPSTVAARARRMIRDLVGPVESDSTDDSKDKA